MSNFWGRAWARTVATALLTVACAAAVHAAPLRAYMSALDEPFFDYSNQRAMTAAFGVQGTDWDRLQYGDAFSTYNMLYIDGGGFTATDMVTFLSGHRSALETFVLGGGRLFINAATDINLGTIDLLFGATLTERADDNRGFTGTAVDGSSELFNGAGTSWDGAWFSHDDIGLAAGYGSLIVDDKGRTVLAGGVFGNGYVMLGGQTNAAVDVYQFSVNGSDPFQLRVNELLYVDRFDTTAPIPEPGSLALVLLAGLAMTQSLRARRA